MPFWVTDYVRVLTILGELDFIIGPISQYWKRPDKPGVLLRHDVDRWPAMAVQLAEHESRIGILSTYYFRCNRHGDFPDHACARIVALGHELGYHYEDYSRCYGDQALALDSFRRNLGRLRRIGPCVSVSMHGQPFSPHDNRLLLDSPTLLRCGLLGDASTGLDRRSPIYFTDAGGAWNDPRVNFRDRLGKMESGLNPLDFATLQATALHWHNSWICFNVHPERWATTSGQYARSVVFDHSARIAKSVIKLLRR